MVNKFTKPKPKAVDIHL